jgi:hypothetical protein
MRASADRVVKIPGVRPRVQTVSWEQDLQPVVRSISALSNALDGLVKRAARPFEIALPLPRPGETAAEYVGRVNAMEPFLSRDGVVIWRA